MSFCWLIIVDAADNKLSDDEEIGGEPWRVLKFGAMEPDYLKLDFYVSYYNFMGVYLLDLYIGEP